MLFNDPSFILFTLNLAILVNLKYILSSLDEFMAAKGGLKLL